MISELCPNHKTGKANQTKPCVNRTNIKSNQHVCTRKQTQIKSATGPVKSQTFLEGLLNRLELNVTINYTSYLFFIVEGIL